MHPTPRTITDIPTGRTLRKYFDDITHRSEFRDEETGQQVPMAYVNLSGLPIDIRTEDGKEYTVRAMQGLNAETRPTHIRYYGKKRFSKL
jgi:hypothetical protein